MVGAGELAQVWIERVQQEPTASKTGLELVPELRDAVLPVGFAMGVEPESYLETDGEYIECELHARLVPPGQPPTAAPPQAGAVGVCIDTKESCIEIEAIELPREVQRRGLGRLMMAGLADLADWLGVGQIKLQAGRTGRYAWARCGFNFLHPESDRPRVMDAAGQFAAALDVRCDLTDVQQPWQLASIGGNVSALDVEIAGGPRAAPGDKDWTLGRALLLGPGENATCWYGTLDPRGGGADRVRLDSYARLA